MAGRYRPPITLEDRSALARPPAPWGRRAAAAAIDLLLVGGPAYVVFFVLVDLGRTGKIDTMLVEGEGGGVEAVGGADTSRPFGLFMAWLMVLVVVPVLYRTALEAWAGGRTIGARLAGVRVRDRRSHGELKLAQAFGRALVAHGSFVVPAVGVLNALSPLWDQGRAWHDRLANTEVVLAE